MLTTYLFASLVLMLVEHFLLDYFVDFFYRTGWTVCRREIKGDWDPEKVVKGETKTTLNSAYRFTKDGQSCFFRQKHRIFIPLIPFAFFRGVAERKDGKIAVTVRMGIGQFLVLLFLEDITGSIYFGIIATILAYLGLKGYFGLNPIGIVNSYFDEVVKAEGIDLG